MLLVMNKMKVYRIKIDFVYRTSIKFLVCYFTQPCTPQGIQYFKVCNP